MRSLVIAPHPDDEVLGVGGTLLRRKSEGGELAWLIVTGISLQTGWAAEKVHQRENEIHEIAQLFMFDEVYNLALPAARLDQIPIVDLIKRISDVINSFQPDEIFLPHPSDVHSDHRVVYGAAVSCTKWFRHPSVKRVLAYETLSETDFGLTPGVIFKPNFFVNIEAHLEEKLRAMKIYGSELGMLPFPRSLDAIRALATIRGATVGFKAAEAFELLRESI